MTSPQARPLPADQQERVRIRTSQERVYVAGSETVLFTVNAMDMQGNPLPLSVTRAIAHDPPLDGKPSKRNSVTVPFNDVGANGDTVAGDTVVSARLNPATQGFANHAGTIRVELNVKVNGVDEQEAIDVITKLFADKFGEE